MENQVKDFLRYLEIEKNASQNTITKYRSDLYKLYSYLKSVSKIDDFNLVGSPHLRDYIEYIKIRSELSSASVSNKISVIKSFFKYLSTNDYIYKNPASLLNLPKKQKKIPRFLNEIELSKLISTPSRATGKRSKKFMIRDKLVLTLFVYTGIRKSELLNLSWDDIPHRCLGKKFCKSGEFYFAKNTRIECLNNYIN